MIILLSPAKTMNLVDAIPNKYPIHKPFFYKNANNLINLLKNMESDDLKHVMNLSEKLLLKVQLILNNFSGDLQNSRQAIFAYRGAVFKGLDSLSLNKKQIQFSQNKIRILSGLYGVLKPLDGIEEYRLDMKTILKTIHSNNLYNYWNELITNYFSIYTNKEFLINLASNEYSKVINFSKLKASKIDIAFGEISNKKIKYPPMYSKMARGKMAGYIVRKMISSPEKLKKFNLDGYTFNSEYSNSNYFLFTR